MTQGVDSALASVGMSAVLNLVVLAGIPFLVYFGYQTLRHKRKLAEVASRTGLKGSGTRYLAYSAGLALAGVGALVLWSPPLDLLVRQGSPQRAFLGLGLSPLSVSMALVYGVVTTGFVEEFLFRGLIAGSLSRRAPLLWANVVQALVFLAPHLLVLKVMPELWMILPLVFVSGLVLGWIRIKSGSIVGPWMIHASVNAATCLGVAIRTGT